MDFKTGVQKCGASLPHVANQRQYLLLFFTYFLLISAGPVDDKETFYEVIRVALRHFFL